MGLSLMRDPLVKTLAPVLSAFLISGAPHADAASLRMYGRPSAPPVNPNCPKTGYVALCEEAWTNAGLYWATSDDADNASQPTWASFSAYARQSGQTWTRNEPDRNKPGIQFPVGPNIADAAMADFRSFANGSGTFQGMSYTKSANIGGDIPGITFTKTCNGGDPYLDLDGFYLNDMNITVTGNSCTIRLSNWTGKAGINMSLANQGSGMTISGTGSPSILVRNYKYAFTDDTHPTPELWGTPAAAGANVQQRAAVTGTIIASNGSSPAWLQIGTGSTGTIYRSSYLDWPGRDYTANLSVAQSEYLQLLWNINWTGVVTCAGSVCTIQSTDPLSPNALPVNDGVSKWMSWGIQATSTPSRQGIFVSSYAGLPAMFTLSGSPSFGSTPTAVVIGSRSCTGSGCNNTLWALSCAKQASSSSTCISQLPAVNGSAASMTVGQAALKGFQIVSSVPCGSYTSRYAYGYKTGNVFLGRGNCAVNVQGDYIAMSSGQIGYAENGDNRGGVPHTNGAVIEQVQAGFGTIAEFTQKNNVVLSDKWNVIGNITSMASLFANSGTTGNNHVDWTLGDISENLLISNRSVNNLIYDGTTTASNGFLIRFLGQGSDGTRQAQFAGSIAANGGGTGKLHVSSVSSGTVAVGDYLKNCTGNICQDYWTGPIRITAQVATEPGDVSTWSTNYFYSSYSGSFDTYKYVPTIGHMNWLSNDLDTTSSGASPMGVATDTPVGSYLCQSNFLMTGSQPNIYNGYGCN